MIFNKLFRPKHQDPDPGVRIKAISTLSPDNPEQKSVLHELAFNDAEPAVSIAALEKLSSFALWSKMADIAKSERVRKKARKTVEQALSGEAGLHISEQERRSYILENQNPALLEQALNNGWVNAPNEVLAILQRIDKPHYTRQYFFTHADEALQLMLLEHIDDSASLNRVVRKSAFPPVVDAAGQKLAAQEQARQLPLQVEKDTTMVLSQLLALADKSDLETVKKKRQQLDAQYQQLAADFVCLNESVRETLQDKYTHINTRLDNWIESIAPQWQLQQVEKQGARELQQIADESRIVVNQINGSLADDLASFTLGNFEDYENRMQACIKRLDALSGSKLSASQHKQCEDLYRQLNACHLTLRRIPEFQQALGQAKGLLASLQALAPPDDVSQIDAAGEQLSQLKRQWREVTTAFKENWPDTLTQQWQQQVNAYQSAIAALQAEVKSQLARCRSKLSAVEGLIAQGRFRAAIALFQRVQEWLETIPQAARGKLSAKLDKVSEQISELKDWQEYIAGPRKPELIAQVQQLVDLPPEIEQLAADIKRLRKTWNSLGNTNADDDQTLNQSFDALIEQAFEPCRVHFARQEEQRQQNLLERQSRLKQLQQAYEQTDDLAQLHHAFNQWQNSWRQCGPVDFRQRKALDAEYQQVTRPVKAKLADYYAQNASFKQCLVQRAEALLQNDAVEDAIEQAKTLQQEWKQIGPVKRRDEQRLWQAFRQHNDAVFARRNQQQQDQRAALKSAKDSLDARLAELQQIYRGASEQAELQQVLQQCAEVGQALADLPPRSVSKQRQTLNQLVKHIQQQQRALKQANRHQEYAALFAVLENWRDAKVEGLDSLANRFQRWFAASADMDRHTLTLMLEITLQQTSPQEDEARRQQIQMQMMAEKLSGGQAYVADELLEQWVACGPLNQDDLALLARLKKLGELF